jgi:hypothetical protein
LLATLHVHDGEPPVPEPVARYLDAALAVGAAVDEALQHSFRDVGFDASVVSRDSAHKFYAPLR